MRKSNNNDRKHRTKRINALGRVPQQISGNGIYRLRLCAALSFSSSATGVVAAFIPTNPNTSGLNNVEYSSISQLYDQVRIRAFKVTILPTAAAVSGVVLTYASTSLVSKIAPASSTLVLDDADSKFLDAQNGTPLELRWISRKFPEDILFSSVGDETTVDNAGCPGGVSIYAQGLTPSVVSYAVIYTAYYEMRNRI